MSHWLKWRLIALFGVVALGVGGQVLRAQNARLSPAKTPEAAGEMFYALLESVNEAESNPRYNEDNVAAFAGAIAPQSLLDNPKTEGFLKLLASQARPPRFAGRVTRSEGGKTFVEVVPSDVPKAREVVVIAQDGGFRVDVFATYGLWNNVSGVALEKQIFELTGVIGPNLMSNLRFAGDARRSQCQSQLKQQMLGILQYTQDYDEKMPPARRWREVIYPYVKSEQIFTCPSLEKGKNGYAFNQNLSQIGLDKIETSWQTIAIYETSNLKPMVFGPGTGRAFRHLEGWNLAFADGHVKWLLKGNPTGSGSFKP